MCYKFQRQKGGASRRIRCKRKERSPKDGPQSTCHLDKLASSLPRTQPDIFILLGAGGNFWFTESLENLLLNSPLVVKSLDIPVLKYFRQSIIESSLLLQGTQPFPTSHICPQSSSSPGGFLSCKQSDLRPLAPVCDTPWQMSSEPLSSLQPGVVPEHHCSLWTRWARRGHGSALWTRQTWRWASCTQHGRCFIWPRRPNNGKVSTEWGAGGGEATPLGDWCWSPRIWTTHAEEVLTATSHPEERDQLQACFLNGVSATATQCGRKSPKSLQWGWNHRTPLPERVS